MNSIRAGLRVSLLLLGAAFALAPRALAGDMTPAERAGLDEDAGRATRHLDAYGKFVARTQQLQKVAAQLRATTGDTPAAEQARQARLRRIETSLLPASQARTKELGQLWDQRWGRRLGPISRYGTTTTITYFQRGEGGAQGRFEDKEVDFLRDRVQSAFRLGQKPKLPAPLPLDVKGGKLPDVPKEILEAPATASQPVTVSGSGKTWETMTSQERHRALLDHAGEAWNAVSEWLFGKDEAKKADATAALGGLPPPPADPAAAPTTLSDLDALRILCRDFEAAILAAIRKEQAGVDPLARWKTMTAEQRHEALLRNDPLAWDALKSLLTSGRPEDVKEVVAALERIPPPAVPSPTPAPVGATRGTIHVSVSRPKSEGGNPFGDESLTEPVDGAEIGYEYLENGQTVASHETTNASGTCTIDVPLDVGVRLRWPQGRQELAPVTCTFDQPETSVSFGGPRFKQGSTAPPDGVPPPEVPPPPKDR